jgi:hypothetical protein
MASPVYIEGLCDKTLVSKPPSIMISFAQEFAARRPQIQISKRGATAKIKKAALTSARSALSATVHIAGTKRIYI